MFQLVMSAMTITQKVPEERSCVRTSQEQRLHYTKEKDLVLLPGTNNAM